MDTKKSFICILAILVNIGFAGAATLSVGDGQVYTTIQAAVDAAHPGDTISVSEGTYYENVLITKNEITLIGEDREKTIIDGGMAGSGIKIVESYNVRISGFTVRNSDNVLEEDGGVNLYRASDSIISNLIVTNNYIGILIDIGSHNNIISGNEVVLNKGKEAKGIKISNSDENRIFNNNIKDNPFGLYSDSGQKNHIYSNNFINNTIQAYDDSGLNTWDDRKNGNYWSDFNGNGQYKIIGIGALDRYPRSGPVIIKFEIFPTSVEQQNDTSDPGLANLIIPILILGAIIIIGAIILQQRKMNK